MTVEHTRTLLEGNITGTFVRELLELVDKENTKASLECFEYELNFSDRVYHARKSNNLEAFVKLSQELVVFAENEKMTDRLIVFLSVWAHRFKKASVEKEVRSIMHL